MANINGNEIYFGIIGSVQSGSNSTTRSGNEEALSVTETEETPLPQEEK